MRGKKKYWYLNALPILFFPMSILTILITAGEIEFAINYGRLPIAFWSNFFEYNFVFWLVLFYLVYYLFCWRRSRGMTNEQVQKLLTRMAIVGSILTLWAARVTYIIYAELSTGF